MVCPSGGSYCVEILEAKAFAAADFASWSKNGPACAARLEECSGDKGDIQRQTGSVRSLSESELKRALNKLRSTDLLVTDGRDSAISCGEHFAGLVPCS